VQSRRNAKAAKCLMRKLLKGLAGATGDGHR
jgi:transposase-like protein